MINEPAMDGVDPAVVQQATQIRDRILCRLNDSDIPREYWTVQMAVLSGIAQALSKTLPDNVQPIFVGVFLVMAYQELSQIDDLQYFDEISSPFGDFLKDLKERRGDL